MKTSLPIEFTFVVRSNQVPASEYICGFTLCDEGEARVLSTFFNDLGTYKDMETVDGLHVLRCVIPANMLNEGFFSIVIDVGLAKVQRFTTDDEHRLSFELINPDGVGARFGLGRLWRNTPLAPLFDWDIAPQGADQPLAKLDQSIA